MESPRIAVTMHPRYTHTHTILTLLYYYYEGPSPQVFITAVNLDSNRKYVLPFNDSDERRWKHFYGALPDLCCIIWRKLDAHNSIHGGDFKHLMWALYFLKVYGKEEDNSNYSGGVDEKTFRKWTHIFVEAISFLESSVIIWDARIIEERSWGLFAN